MHCSSCGLERDVSTMAAFQRTPEVAVCRDCIGSLARRSGMLDVTPILSVRAMPESIDFYRAAGFEVEPYDEAFAFVRYVGASVFDLQVTSRGDPAAGGGGCFIVVDDCDVWHERLAAAQLDVTPVVDEPWGMREFTLTDPSGNRLRFGRRI